VSELPLKRHMSPRANIYLECTIGIGIFLLLDGLTEFNTANLPHFLAYLFAAILAATLKFNVPELPVGYSPVFAFVLLGIANYSLGETLTIGCMATLAQCLWRPEVRTTRQMLFSAAVVASGITVAYNPSHFLLSQGLHYAPRVLPLAAMLYFIVETALHAGMLSLVRDEPYAPIWKQIVRYSLLYDVAAGLIATVMIVTSRYWGWQMGLLLAPLLYLMHRSYGFYLSRKERYKESASCIPRALGMP
jgi:hypothetical protein